MEGCDTVSTHDRAFEPVIAWRQREPGAGIYELGVVQRTLEVTGNNKAREDWPVHMQIFQPIIWLPLAAFDDLIYLHLDGLALKHRILTTSLGKGAYIGF